MRFKDILQYGPPTAWNLLKMVFYPTALHRVMLRGKIRRFWLAYFRRRYVEEVLLPRRKSTCRHVGACCELGFGCPAFDAQNRLCKIHPHKPLNCKLFPITEADIRERNLLYPQKSCGYSFVPASAEIFSPIFNEETAPSFMKSTESY